MMPNDAQKFTKKKRCFLGAKSSVSTKFHRTKKKTQKKHCPKGGKRGNEKQKTRFFLKTADSKPTYLILGSSTMHKGQTAPKNPILATDGINGASLLSSSVACKKTAPGTGCSTQLAFMLFSLLKAIYNTHLDTSSGS